MYQSILRHGSFQYLKFGLALSALAIVSYAAHDPVDGRNGGTWLGYALGGVSALLVLWLMWYGIRKRRYASRLGTVKGWVSAHVYLGLSLIIVATLHAGFQVGLNVHTLAYVLMLLVIASGMYGVYAYARYPELLTRTSRSESMLGVMTGIAEIDTQCRAMTASLSDAIHGAVLHSIEDTRIGGSVWSQLRGVDRRCATARACGVVESSARQCSADEAPHVRRLLTLLNRKLELLRRARQMVRYKALMDIWLYLHVPLSFALLAALVSHVVAVFFYW